MHIIPPPNAAEPEQPAATAPVLTKAKFKAGINVFAKVEGKEIGPIYLVQIDGDQATLQGAKPYVIPVTDIIKEAP